MKKVFGSLIGQISHNIQIIAVDQPMSEVCSTVGKANYKSLSRLQNRHIRLSLPASKPQTSGTALLPVQLFENVSVLLSGCMETLKKPLEYLSAP